MPLDDEELWVNSPTLNALCEEIKKEIDQEILKEIGKVANEWNRANPKNT